jgi:hypothetical protein
MREKKDREMKEENQEMRKKRTAPKTVTVQMKTQMEKIR